MDRFKVHQRVVDGATADVIIFVGPEFSTFLDFRRSDEWRKYPEKCFIYYGGDRPLPLLPGVYTSLERRFYAPSWTRTASYLRVAENANINDLGSVDKCDLLYSFSGAGINHQVRRKILGLQHTRGVVLDTSSLPVQERQRDAPTRPEDKYVDSYLSLLMRSKFILCPRGVGTSSWRLFETMKAGRVPVIISDQWVPPEGPSWLECSIRVPESEVMLIPETLERREVDARKLALAARKAWDDWFSSDVIFHRIVEWCLAIQADRSLPTKIQSLLYHVRLLRPHFFRYWLMADIKRYVLSR
ncbi:MAG TPA: exostosin family protein [Bryobacteraceae bacterium]|nr:exostosin family protein [Bryobacteraceae bacterium]